MTHLNHSQHPPAIQNETGSAAMLLRVSDPNLVDDLCAHFQRAGFAVQWAGEGMVEAHRLDAPEADQDTREVEFHLNAWKAMRPSVTVEIVG